MLTNASLAPRPRPAGKSALDEADFRRCWFQLVDSHTESVDAEDYAEWIVSAVAQASERVGEREWESLRCA